MIRGNPYRKQHKVEHLYLLLIQWKHIDSFTIYLLNETKRDCTTFNYLQIATCCMFFALSLPLSLNCSIIAVAPSAGLPKASFLYGFDLSFSTLLAMAEKSIKTHSTVDLLSHRTHTNCQREKRRSKVESEREGEKSERGMGAEQAKKRATYYKSVPMKYH